MAYCTRLDIEKQYGKSNVKKWADLNGNADAADIEERIDEAIEDATDDVDLVLGKMYTTPFVGTLPKLLIRLTAKLAGVKLYEARGVPDADEDGNVNHQLAWHRDYVQRMLRAIAGGAYKLGTVQPAVGNFPSVILDATEDDTIFPANIIDE